MTAYADDAARDLSSISVRHSEIGSSIWENSSTAQNSRVESSAPIVMTSAGPSSDPASSTSKAKMANTNQSRMDATNARKASWIRLRSDTDSSRLTSTGRNCSPWLR